MGIVEVGEGVGRRPIGGGGGVIVMGGLRRRSVGLRFVEERVAELRAAGGARAGGGDVSAAVLVGCGTAVLAKCGVCVVGLVFDGDAGQESTALGAVLKVAVEDVDAAGVDGASVGEDGTIARSAAVICVCGATVFCP